MMEEVTRMGWRRLPASEIAARRVLVRMYIERLAAAGLGWPGYRRVAEDLGLPACGWRAATGVREIVTDLCAAGWMRQRRSGRRVAVELADGRWLAADADPAGSLQARREIADALLADAGRQRRPRKRRARTEDIERPCISCGRQMRSTGPHHRMCGQCRRDAQPWLAGAELVD